MKNLTYNDFQNNIFDVEDNYINNKPTILNFSALWCSPCKQMSPIVTELSKEYDGKIDLYKVDIEEEEDLTSKFGIRSVPTFLFIDKNGEQKRVSGSMSKDKFKSLIDGLIEEKEVI